MLKYQLKSASECSNQEIERFYSLEVQAGKVQEEGLKAYIQKAHALAFAYKGDQLVGVGALKNPRPNSKRRLFIEEAQSSLSPNDYAFELGWVLVVESCRNEGIGKNLTTRLAQHSDQGIYASTALPEMQGILAKLGFLQEGQTYPCMKNPDEPALSLYVRPRAG